ncbi:MAG: hypothetical protein DME69_01745 [Verrucomicrobia bacterium]|nr:MAG: hypothetical protein DME69_01745 [Verrucomicrobiota bacterium]
MKAVALGAGKVSYPRLAAFRARLVVGRRNRMPTLREDFKDEFDGGNRPLALGTVWCVPEVTSPI